MVGMARPKKRKLETVETTVEGGTDVKNDTGVTGAQQPELDEAEQGAAAVDPAPGLGGKRWKAALEAFEKASEKAILARCLAHEHEKKEKLAMKIFDAKWKRLEAGDKLKRRKKTLGAARRSYEAIIALSQAQHVCQWYRCRAAEAERDAARAEMRVMELGMIAYAVRVERTF